MRHEVRKITLAAVNATAGTAMLIRDLMNACVYVHQEAGGDAFSVKVQVKISVPAAATVVPAGNPLAVAAPTTTKPQSEVASDADSNDDWVDFGGAITAPAMVPLCTNGGSFLPFTHVRIYTTTFTAGSKPVKAVIAGYNPRTH